MRRIALLAAAVAALACTSAASTALQPIRRPHARDAAPRMWKGPLQIPREHFRGRVRVIARLDLPPLAAAYNEDLAVGGSSRRLDVSTGSVAPLSRPPRAGAERGRHCHPPGDPGRRRLAPLPGHPRRTDRSKLPVRRLTTLAGLPFVTRIYPSVAYKLSLNDSTHLIRADTFWATTGDRGEGVKIGVVDDGVDERHIFFAPTGMSYPTRVPEGRAQVDDP